MRRPLTFDCDGATLAGVLHPAAGDIGVVIVSGGVQTRAGAHRGFVALADRLAAAGYPTLRFERRGVGDSDGDDRGFRDSDADIAAAIVALRGAFTQLKHIVGWGLCDGATALALNAGALGLDGLILANPWTRDADAPADLPPRAAVAARYRQRLTSPREWLRLVRHGVDLRKAVKGLWQVTRSEATPQTALGIAMKLQDFDGPVLILLSGRDATAQAFQALWGGPTFKAARARGDRHIVTLPDATHTFAGAAEIARMAAACVAWLDQRAPATSP